MFVARPKIEQSLDTVAGLSDQLESRGVAPGADVLVARTVEAGELGDAEVAARLGLSEGDPVHVIQRIRTGDGEPLVLEENYLPEQLFPGLLEEDLTAGLYASMRERYGISPARSRQELEPTLIDARAATALGIGPGAPALKVTRVAWDAAREADRVRPGSAPRRPAALRSRRVGGRLSHPGRSFRRVGRHLLPVPKRRRNLGRRATYTSAAC